MLARLRNAGRGLGVWAVAVALAALGAAARAQTCEGWREGGGVLGTTGRVLALTVWDPDGLGPKPSMVIAGGGFGVAGDALCFNVAAWDGGAWQPLGEAPNVGVNNNGVQALTVYNNQVIAGGGFTRAGAAVVSNVAAWNGTEWAPLGNPAANAFNGQVLALGLYRGQLVAAGEFTHIGSLLVNRVALWDGASWRPLPGAGGAVGVGQPVNAVAEFNGELIVAGGFSTAGGAAASNIAAWSSAGGWRALGAPGSQGLNGPVEALEVLSGSLFAGGSFSRAGGATAFNIARWDGSGWGSLGSGAENGVDQPVQSLAVFGGSLIVGGQFNTAGGNPANKVASWRSGSWEPLAGGLGDFPRESVDVLALAAAGDELVAAGTFSRAGGRAVSNVARWVNSDWTAAGSGSSTAPSNRVDCTVEFQGRLIAGGFFAEAGGRIVNNVASWDGADWTPMGPEEDPGMSYTVFALAVFRNELIAGGAFTRAGGVECRRVARWDGTRWQPMGAGLGSGIEPDEFVNALAVYNNELYAAGNFTLSGSTVVNHIARWDGTSWRPVGDANGVGFPDWVYALAVHDGELFAGGRFTARPSGGGPMNRVARWNGILWQPLLDSGGANGVDNEVYALASFNNELYAGGEFAAAAGRPASRVARWNRVQWRTLPGVNQSNGVSGRVVDFTRFQGALVVGGQFGSAGGASAGNIARWTGSAWGTFGAGLFDAVTGLGTFDPDGGGARPPLLCVGGRFGVAGDQASPFFAVWGPPSTSLWAAAGSGSAFVPGNWQCGVAPDAAQNMLFERIDGIATDIFLTLPSPPPIQTPLNAKRLTVNTDTVRLNLGGRDVNLVGRASDRTPPLLIGAKGGLSATDRPTLEVLNSAGSLATLRAGAAAVGKAPATQPATLTLNGAGVNAEIAGTVSVGSLGPGTLEVRAGARLATGGGPADYFGVGLFDRRGTGPGGTLRVRTGGRIESGSPAAPMRSLSLGSAPGALATVEIDGGGSLWTSFQQDLFIGDLGAANVLISRGAVWDTSSGNSVVIGRLTGVGGSVRVDPGSAWLERVQAVTIGGLGTGQLNVRSQGSVEAPGMTVRSGGVLSGAGLVRSRVFNTGGVISPGDTVGALFIDGDLTMTQAATAAEAGRLVLDVGGPTPGVDHDQLLVTGLLQLGGSLFIERRNNYAFDNLPPGGLRLLEVDPGVGERRGQFDVVVMPGLSDRRFLQVAYPESTGPVVLTVGDLQGGISFPPPGGVRADGVPTAMAVDDLDRDGFDDVALTIPGPAGQNGSLVVLINGQQAPGGPVAGFERTIQIAVGRGPSGVTIGDLNNDGVPDLAVTNEIDSTVSIVRNTGTGQAGAFSVARTQPTPEGPSSVAIFDLNGDALDDLAVTTRGGAASTVSAFVNTGGFITSQGPSVTLPMGSMPAEVRAFDPDNDKRRRPRRTLAVVNEEGGSASVILGSGNGTLPQPITLPVGEGPTRLVVRDLNNDNRPELVTLNARGGSVSIVPNAGAVPGQPFNPAVEVPVAGGRLQSLAVLDLDVDGDNDLAVVAGDNPGERVVEVLRNDYNGVQLALAPAGRLNADPNSRLIDDGDLNGDGARDVVTANERPPGDGPGEFTFLSFSGNGVPPTCPGDWDGDGTVDFNDFLAFLNDFNTRNPRADLDGDGSIDFNDFLAFLNLFNTPC